MNLIEVNQNSPGSLTWVKSSRDSFWTNAGAESPLTDSSGQPDMLSIVQDPAGTAAGLITAAVVGAVVGLVWQRAGGRMAAAHTRIGGSVVLALVAISGGLGALLGGAALVAGAVLLGLVVCPRRRYSQAAAAHLIVLPALYLVGALAVSTPATAILAGSAILVILVGGPALIRKVNANVSNRDLRDIATVLAAGFLILPLLPDRTVDPWEVINPSRLGTLIVALMAVSVGAHLALRHLGPRSALALTGFAGGFVSSTATIAAMADGARSSPRLAPAFAGAALLSNVAMILQLGLVMGTLAPALLAYSMVPLVCSAIVAMGTALAFGWRSLLSTSTVSGLAIVRPFKPLAILVFVGLIVILLLAASLLRDWLGDESLPWTLGISGIADVHAATASAAQMVGAERISNGIAIQAITIALATNSLLKCLIAAARGGWRFSAPLLIGTSLIVGTFAVAAGRSG
ncbi:DUF4010 domain-containing protein [Stenotrophomonas sp. TWI587]|uniref:MgtC/SapB family protein n=1 Tax=Stenotrophomonas sp. TWI587 TaxID=3136783 RepID=UPI0032086632